MKRVSNSNTKADILKAYEALVVELKEERKENSALQQKLKQQQTAVQQAQQQTKGGNATQSIQLLRETFNHQLDAIEEGLEKEQVAFQALQATIAQEQKTLEEVYKIKAEAESLEALLITNKQAREKLEQEMKARKADLLEDIEATKVQWKREQEAYEYKLKVQRRNETDAYEQKKAQQEQELAQQKQTFEREVAEREQAVEQQEQELERLQALAAQFDSRLEKAVAAAQKATKEQLTKELDFKHQLETKDMEAALKLHQQEIESLKQQVAERQTLIDSLSSKTDNATQQVKDIALKAIENAGQRPYIANFERRKEEED
ncbi:MAG: hypothetical protein AAF798_22425 [Bacteroidota bacterium]